MTTFSHSGTTGDVLSSLCLVKILGGGDYYLRLNNLDSICRSIGWGNAGRHSGRMTQRDFDTLEPLMRIQPQVKSFQVYKGEQIDYEFEKTAHHMNPPGWPRSFTRQYAAALAVDPEQHHRELDIESFLIADRAYKVPGRPIMIARNRWYLDGIADPSAVPQWQNWIECGLADQSFYCGLEEEHQWFESLMKVKIPWVKTEDCLELARYQWGCELIIANQSMPGTMAINLGKTCWIETRKNTPLENNEIYYPYKINVNYF